MYVHMYESVLKALYTHLSCSLYGARPYNDACLAWHLRRDVLEQ